MGTRSKNSTYGCHDRANERRLKFAALCRSNPCNFIPSSVQRYLQRSYRSQIDMERAAARWIEGENGDRKAWGQPLIRTTGWAGRYDVEASI